MDLYFETSLLPIAGEAFEQGVGGMDGRRIPHFGGEMVDADGLWVVGRHDMDLASGQSGHVGGDNDRLPGCLRVVGPHQDCFEHDALLLRAG